MCLYLLMVPKLKLYQKTTLCTQKETTISCQKRLEDY